MNRVIQTIVAIAILPLPLFGQLDFELRFKRPDPSEGRGFVLSVDRTSKILIEDTEFTTNQVAAVLKALTNANPDAIVTIVGHSQARHVVVATLRDTAKKAGVNPARLVVMIRKSKEHNEAEQGVEDAGHAPE